MSNYILVLQRTHIENLVVIINWICCMMEFLMSYSFGCHKQYIISHQGINQPEIQDEKLYSVNNMLIAVYLIF